jgi:hypothetical protein
MANGTIWLASLARERALRIALEAGLGKPGQQAAKAINTIEALNRESMPLQTLVTAAQLAKPKMEWVQLRSPFIGLKSSSVP